MRPIVNMPEKDRATDIFKMHKKLVKIALVVPEISSRTDMQTDRQSDILITILRNRSLGRSDKKNDLYDNKQQLYHSIMRYIAVTIRLYFTYLLSRNNNNRFDNLYSREEM